MLISASNEKNSVSISTVDFTVTLSKYNIGLYLRHTEDNGEIVICFS